MSGELVGYEALVARINALATSPRPRIALLKRWQMLAVREAKLRVPRKTGTLGRSIHPGYVDEDQAAVVASAAYARYVEEGTGTHAGRGYYTIKPVHAKVLAWGGARRLSGNLRTGAKPEFFAKSVQHPGIRAKPYLRPGAMAALEQLDMQTEFIAAWNGAA